MGFHNYKDNLCNTCQSIFPYFFIYLFNRLSPKKLRKDFDLIKREKNAL